MNEHSNSRFTEMLPRWIRNHYDWNLRRIFWVRRPHRKNFFSFCFAVDYDEGLQSPQLNKLWCKINFYVPCIPFYTLCLLSHQMCSSLAKLQRLKKNFHQTNILHYPPDKSPSSNLETPLFPGYRMTTAKTKQRGTYNSVVLHTVIQYYTDTVDVEKIIKDIKSVAIVEFLYKYLLQWKTCT